MIFIVKELMKELRKFHQNDLIEITKDEIIYVQSSLYKKRKVSESLIFSMSDMGIGSTEIGKELGVSKQYVNDILRKKRKFSEQIKTSAE